VVSVLRCEVCGGQIFGKPRKVLIEGAKMLVCQECAKLGSIHFEPEVKSSTPSYVSVKRARTTPMAATLSARRRTATVSEDFDIKEGFGSLIRRARERLGLSQEDLGKKIGEKVSILKKIEVEKISPDQRLARKLEHVLKVELLVPRKDYEILEDFSSPHPSGVTLGEIAELKTKNRRRSENEGNNSSSKTSV
jgi:putative transcription factor